MGLPIIMYDTDIFDVVAAQTGGSPCYLCARMRRGYLYKNAQKLGCNKIALGHHFDDVIETILMSMLYGGQIQTMMPKLHSTNHPGMELIRPLYYVKEADIIKWCKHNDLDFIQCACRFTEGLDLGRENSKRQEIKKLIKDLKKVFEKEGIVHHSINESSKRIVNKDNIPEYILEQVKYIYRDDYNLEKLIQQVDA